MNPHRESMGNIHLDVIDWASYELPGTCTTRRRGWQLVSYTGSVTMARYGGGKETTARVKLPRLCSPLEGEEVLRTTSVGKWVEWVGEGFGDEAQR